MLKSKKLRLVVHSHPDYNDIEVSDDNRSFLTYIDQKKSMIVSYITGETIEFSTNMFDDI